MPQDLDDEEKDKDIATEIKELMKEQGVAPEYEVPSEGAEGLDDDDQIDGGARKEKNDDGLDGEDRGQDTPVGDEDS
jgi:hypothetical protein